MSVTFLNDEQAYILEGALEEDGHLWITAHDVESTTGWALKPEGLCAEAACVPLPPDGSWRDAHGRIDLAAFARHLGRPLVRDGKRPLWALGASSANRRDSMLSLEAPDFSLPDLDGKMHSLSDYRGKKVLLYAWASY